jgi:UDP-glucose 4-epimerase
MRALVTGGAGFIASHIVDAYVARGWDVTILDDFSSGVRSNVNPAAELVECDVRDAKALQTIRDLRPDLVSHHAAQLDVRKSVADPGFDAEVNVVASVRLLEACAAAGVKRFVFASTGGAIYGEPDFVPQTEEHPQAPMSPYGCAKLAVEHYLRYFREIQSLQAVALRYANVYGPRQNAHGEAGVVAIFAEKMLRGDTVTINGSGAQTRDFVYVADVVRANLAVTDDLTLEGSFNVGTGIETSVNQLHEAMAAIARDPKSAVHAPAKTGEQMRSVLDGSRLRRAAGLPEPVMLRDGLAETLRWFREGIPA